MLRKAVLLCTIAVQVLSAPNPNGCTESCTTYHTQSTHNALVQQQTAALNELNQLASQLQGSQVGLDSTRPGNWTEHNEYRTDGGAGRVYEEKGQIVNGGRRIRYYQKNYSSSHGSNTGDVGNVGNYGDAQGTIASQRLTGVASGLDNVGHRRTYDEQSYRRIHQSTNGAAAHSGRLEDFNVNSDAQVLQSAQVPTTSNGGTWHTSNSWRVDGGRGTVHEEQGQVVDGGSRVVYRRKNYTSSYSSGDVGAVVPSIVQPNLEAEIQNIHQQLNTFGGETHQSTIGHNSLDVAQTTGHNSYVNENRYTSNSQHLQRPATPIITYDQTQTQNEQQATVHHGTVVSRPSTRNYHRTTEGQYHETGTTGTNYNSANILINDNRARPTPQRLYVVPAQPIGTVQRTESHQAYQETVVPTRTIVHSSVNDHSVDRSSSNLVRVPIHTNNNYGSFHADGGDYQNVQTTYDQSQQVQNDMLQSSQHRTRNHGSVNRHGGYTDSNAEFVNLGRQPAVVKHVEENWSASGHRRVSTVPQSTSTGSVVLGHGGNYVRAGQTGGQLGYTSSNLQNTHSSQYASGSSYNQQGYGSQTGQLVTGALDLGPVGQAADCDQTVTSQQFQYASTDQGRYKRDDARDHHHRNLDSERQSAPMLDFSNQEPSSWDKAHMALGHQEKEDLAQQTSDFDDYQQSSKLELGQDTQHTEDLTQQTSGFGDYTQQTSENLQFGQHEQQQHSGKLEFGQDTQQTEDLTQQTSGFGDHAQQATGKLELGQQHEQQTGQIAFGDQSQQSEDMTQQASEYGDYTQQSGKIEFGQNSQQTEDLTQQTSGFGDDYQQTSGSLVFGQQEQQQHTGKLEFGQNTQQTEDQTQQTSGFGDYAQQQTGKLEFGQHNEPPAALTLHSSGSEDCTEKTSESLFAQHERQHAGKIELGQNTQSGMFDFGPHGQQNKDLTAQQAGNSGIQQISGSYTFGQAPQQTEDLTQQTSGFGDYTQEQSGIIDFGPHSQQNEDLTAQQTSNFGTQQTEDQQSGIIDFGPHSQQNRDVTGQQTSGFGDYTQQQSGIFDFGPHSHQNEDRTVQQTSGFGDYTQQQSGIFDFGPHSQQNEDRTVQQTSGFGDYTQQQSGIFDFGPHSQQNEDRTVQQTSSSGTQQNSGSLVFGQQEQQQQTGKVECGQATQQTEDLTQQTSGLGDVTPQTSGSLEFGQQHEPQTGTLEFGQHTQHPAGQQTEDLSQQTQQTHYPPQTSGSLESGQQHEPQTGTLEFGQHTQHPAGQQTEDLSQQTHYPPQTSGSLESGQQHEQQTGTLEFGQHTQHPAGQQTEDLSQQTQQTHYPPQTSDSLESGQQHEQQTGTLEFGQHTQHPAGQQTEDLSQQTQQTHYPPQTSGSLESGQQHEQQTGTLEFGQHTQHPAGQQTEDLSQQTQQTHYPPQTSGSLEFGQQHEQHTGTLEFGQHTQHPAGQQTEDLSQQTQQTHYPPQTSGSLEFGQQHEQQTGTLEFGQHTQHPAGQQTEDLSQQTQQSGFPQQTSGSLEFGQQHQQQTGTLEFGQHTQHPSSQQTEDLSQQTQQSGFPQQTSGSLEFGQEHEQQTGTLEFGQHTQHPTGQQTEDLSQQTQQSGFPQQTSGSLEFGQQHQQQTGTLEFGQHTQHPAGQQTEDLSQQTQQSAYPPYPQQTQHGRYPPYPQQTSGSLEFGQQHQQQTGTLEFGQHTQHPAGQQTEDLSQQTQQSGFPHYPQKTSGNLEFGQQQQTGPFGSETTTMVPRIPQNTGGVKGGRRRRPAPKPTLRPHQRFPHSGGEAGDTDIPSISSNSPFDVQPEIDLDNAHHSTNAQNAELQNVPTVQSIEERQREANQRSPLKNNPSAQWHMTHNPGDLTNSENFGTPQGSHGIEQNQQTSSKFQQSSMPSEPRKSRQDGNTQAAQNGEKDSKFESRILEAYGGNGPYDAGHNEDIFGNAKVNPSATLAPNPDSNQDPWTIREKPVERPVERSTGNPVYLDPTRITFPTDAPEVSTEPTSFWRRVGHRISTTYEKARDKAASVFGK